MVKLNRFGNRAETHSQADLAPFVGGQRDVDRIGPEAVDDHPYLITSGVELGDFIHAATFCDSLGHDAERVHDEYPGRGDPAAVGVGDLPCERRRRRRPGRDQEE